VERRNLLLVLGGCYYSVWGNSEVNEIQRHKKCFVEFAFLKTVLEQ
jgi:hypothetical protein